MTSPTTSTMHKIYDFSPSPILSPARRSYAGPSMSTTTTSTAAGDLATTTSPGSMLSRSPSPLPWANPNGSSNNSSNGGSSPALTPAPRSVSTPSTISSNSSRSRLSDPGTGSISTRLVRRGYMRPQSTVFADSARHRESVMSLGSIAHLQYYFARTGLLDGKGAQLARAKKTAAGTSPVLSAGPDATQEGMVGAQVYLSAPSGASGDGVGLGIAGLGDGGEEGGGTTEDAEEWYEPVMLPPTVSTYQARPAYVEPPPDVTELRRELRHALEEARKVLREVAPKSPAVDERGEVIRSPDGTPVLESQGWYEIEGLHFLDVVTLAIRAAKNYYTAHERPGRLYAIRSERDIRKDLYEVLEILKRMATRTFAGGVRHAERDRIGAWVEGIWALLDEEERREAAEQEARERSRWRDGDWTGREREREWLFLRSFDEHPADLPAWEDPDAAAELPTPFLRAFQSGLRLVRLHNELVRASRRQFEEITVFHTDTKKPYRCADNLRYWIKAAELRWDVQLEVDVMGVVHGDSVEAWRGFDRAILRWCRGVREEIVAEWREWRRVKGLVGVRTPSLRVEGEEGKEEGEGKEDEERREVEVEGKTEAQPETKTKTESKMEVKTEGKTETNTEVKTEVKTEEAEPQAKTETATATEAKTTTESKATSKAKPQTTVIAQRS